MQSLTDVQRKLWFGYKEASGLKVSPKLQTVSFLIYRNGEYSGSYFSSNSIGLMSDTFTLKRAISAPNTFAVAGSIITSVIAFDVIKDSTLDVALKDFVYDEPFESYVKINWGASGIIDGIDYHHHIGLGMYYLNSRAINDKVVSYEFYDRSSILDTFTVSAKSLNGYPLDEALHKAVTDSNLKSYFYIGAGDLPESLKDTTVPAISEDYVFTARQALQFLGEYYGLVYKVSGSRLIVSRLKPNIEHDRFPHAEIFKTSFEYEDDVDIHGTRIYYDSALFYEVKYTGSGIVFPHVVKDNPWVFDEASAIQCSGYRNIDPITTKVGYVEHWSCPALEPGDLFVLDDKETSFMFVTEIVYRLNGLMTIKTSMDLAGVQNDILTYNNTNANKTPPSSTSSTTSASTLSFGTTSLRATTSLNSYVEDCGEGVLDDEGTLYIDLNPVFSEVVDVSSYLVFLQQYGGGSLYVYSKEDYHFVVKGTPGLRFAWCVKGLRNSTNSETR